MLLRARVSNREPHPDPNSFKMTIAAPFNKVYRFQCKSLKSWLESRSLAVAIHESHLQVSPRPRLRRC